ncbi:MAG: hypothetical protein IPF42_07405 [Candidatus Microthrix sp.]|nr:hypothetical protein [Candidatus Microthrix sp.]
MSTLLVATKTAGKVEAGDILAAASSGFVGNISLTPRSGKYTNLEWKKVN